MKIAVVHNQVSDRDAPDARDVLVQAETVAAGLAGLGHEVETLSCTLNLESMRKRLLADRPDLVFNLVEDLGGSGRLIHLFPFLLDTLRIPYSGAPAEAIFLTSHKTMAKERMRAHNLPTPEWIGPVPPRPSQPPTTGKRAWIVKSLWEHASIGLDADSVLSGVSGAELGDVLRARGPRLGGACFAEEFIEGREFNLSLLTGEGGPVVLPPAEILFEDFGTDTPKIVDYRAKWDEGSHAYHHTPRTFDFPAEDEELLDRLRKTALRCWEVFGLEGYARVDFRVDNEGTPFILEINANPCLSPDAGFAAALARGGLGFDRALARVTAAALRRNAHEEE
ncbi:MAG: ATP-grasp domain-containing protein [Desulfobulbaceae bacterium]